MERVQQLQDRPLIGGGQVGDLLQALEQPCRLG